MEQTLRIRRVKLIIAVAVMLFAAVVYTWPILKAPFEVLSDGVIENATQLGINFALTIIFFCLGGLAAGFLSKRITTTLRFVLAALILFTSFFSSSLQTVTLSYSGNYFLLYLSYGVLGGLGTGIAFVTVISTINAWYPDKKVFVTVPLLITFCLSILLIGTLANAMGSADAIGWRAVYVILSIVTAGNFIVAAIFIRPPPHSTVLPWKKAFKKRRIEFDD